MANITIAVAFFAGLVSFFAPCILPLLPGFIAYLSGTKLKIYLDGQFYKELEVKDEQLYPLIEGDSYGEHLVRIETESNLRAFTFTFG